MVFVGIDVSKDKLDVCFLQKDTKLYLTVVNSVDGFEQILNFCSLNFSKFVPHVLFESTGSYSLSLCEFLTKQKILYKMVNPQKTHAYFKVVDLKGKSDRKDSFVLAHYASSLKSTDFNSFYSKESVLFSRFLSSLGLLDKQITQLNNHLKNLPSDDKFIRPSLEKLRDEMKKSKEELEKESKEQLKKQYGSLYVELSSIKGVGNKTILGLLPKMFDSVELYSKKKFVSFFGFCPIDYSSGSSIYKPDRMSRSGNHYIKKILYFASLSAVRYNEIFKAFYDRQVQNGKNAKVVLINVCKKIIELFYIRIYRYKSLSCN